MSIMPGSKFGPYEILAPIGAGGMGEVYRAKDTRLDRVVAIKVLHGAFAADPERLRRFEQEAKTLATLNHPNILAVLDIGSEDGAPYLVSEFLEGETLREKLDRGPIPVRKAIEYALGIANGLAAGHSKGIVHRDIKPENIFLTREGRIKILDFGLAKLTQPAAQDANATLLTSGATTPGVVLGTVGYMSPEQVRGEPAEATSDIFSFGAVLYEMLSGKRAFKRDTAAETMTAVLREDPPELTDSGWHGPPALQRILDRCLEKDPRRRFQSASDLAFAIESLSGSGASSSSGSQTALPPVAAFRKSKWLWPAVAVGALALIGAGWLIATRLTSQRLPRFRQLTFQRGFISTARFSKDGNTVVYSGQFNNEPMRLFSVRTNQLQPVTINASSATLFAISQQDEMAIGAEPDIESHHVVGTLAKLPISGGTPRQIQAKVVSADYAPDGQTLALTRFEKGKCRLEYPAGKLLYENSGYLDYVRVSPDGKTVAFLDHFFLGDDRGFLAVVDSEGKVRRLTGEYESIQGVVWAKEGREIWYTGSQTGNSSQIRAVDLEGHDRPILGASGQPRLHDIAADGRLLLGDESDYQTITAGDGAGKEATHLELYNGSELSDISPDGKAILFEEWGGPAGSLYLMVYRKSDGSPPVVLGPGADPVLSPDGKTAAGVLLTSPLQVVLYPIGPGESRTVPVPDMVGIRSLAWMPDGKRVALVGAIKGQPVRTTLLDLSTGKLEPLGPVEFLVTTIARDGHRMVGTSPDGQVIFDSVTGMTQPVPHLNPGEVVERWTKDGQGLLVVASDSGKTSVFHMDLATGKRTLLRTVELNERAGIIPVSLTFALLMAENEKAYAYETRTEFATLYEVEGVR